MVCLSIGYRVYKYTFIPHKLAAILHSDNIRQIITFAARSEKRHCGAILQVAE